MSLSVRTLEVCTIYCYLCITNTGPTDVLADTPDDDTDEVMREGTTEVEGNQDDGMAVDSQNAEGNVDSDMDAEGEDDV